MASSLYEVAKFKEREMPTGQIFTTLNDPSTFNMQERYHVSELLEILIIKQMAILSPLNSGSVIYECVGVGKSFHLPPNQIDKASGLPTVTHSFQFLSQQTHT
ncbi:MAG: hypothetical protein M1821_009338 [Bathelium mastoideum]|nr:MAG: hypothetical protein M1821_009338 [Bathelium mastoideum]KAI9686956.1 MAG: hypothetical protein M1822_002709 [Bathelium mastoideum]